MTLGKSQLSDLLYTALGEDLGIIVETNNVNLLRAKLYSVIREDPALTGLSLAVSRTQPESQLWIVKRRPNGQAD